MRENLKGFEIKDSGERQEFGTGSVRDTRKGKGRYELLPPQAIHRLAQHFANGCAKYGDRNWEKGQPLSRYLDSALRHLFKYLGGSRSEDHIIAAAWNALCFVQTEHWINEGKLPKELDDVNVVSVQSKSSVIRRVLVQSKGGVMHMVDDAEASGVVWADSPGEWVCTEPRTPWQRFLKRIGLGKE